MPIIEFGVRPDILQFQLASGAADIADPRREPEYIERNILEGIGVKIFPSYYITKYLSFIFVVYYCTIFSAF